MHGCEQRRGGLLDPESRIRNLSDRPNSSVVPDLASSRELTDFGTRGRRCLRPGAERACDTQLLHAMTQRCRLHAELERGAMIAFDDPVRRVEHTQDVFALDMMQPGI